MKARLSMKDDKQALEEIEYFARQLGTQHLQNNKGCLGLILGPFINILQRNK